LAVMDSRVACEASTRPVLRSVRAPFAFRIDVVELHADGRPTPRRLAPAAIAHEHEAHHRERHAVTRPLRLVAIDRADVERIATRGLDRRGIDGDLATAAMLPALATLLAHGERDEVLRLARLAGQRPAIEVRAAQRAHQLVVFAEAASLLASEALDLTVHSKDVRRQRGG